MVYLVKTEGQPERELSREELLDLLVKLVDDGRSVFWFERGKERTVGKGEVR